MCGSPGTTKLTCPLNTKAENPDPSKHRSWKNDWNLETLKKGKLLGKGGFGTVNQYVEDGNSYAVKAIPKKKLSTLKAKESLANEIKYNKKLSSNDNICKIYGFTENKDNVYLIQNICGEPFSKDLKSVSVSRRVKWFSQLLSAVKYCHDNNVIHMDIKMLNCLLDKDDNLQLMDFGLAEAKGAGPFMAQGTPTHMPPEMLKDFYGKSFYATEAGDAWACGIAFVSMFNEFFIYRGQKTLDALRKKITEEPITKEMLNDIIPGEYIDIVLGLLEHDPKKRLSVSDALSMLTKLSPPLVQSSQLVQMVQKVQLAQRS